MKMIEYIKIRVFALLILVMVFSSCVRNKNGAVVQSNLQKSTNVFEVAEVLQASSYSYLKVKENAGERWVAVSKQEIQPGDVYYYDSALEMENFESKDLDRTFDVIYFINQISKTPLSQQPMMGGEMGMGNAMPPHSGKVETDKLSTISVDKTENELTLAELFTNREEYASKEFEIRGVVVKVNKEIMGKNWIHIQDGTNHGGEFDLTITTQELTEVGAEVTFKGKLSLNKDFGAGYAYDVIMEDGKLINSKMVGTKL